MNKLQVFKNELFEVAVKLENGELVFDLENVVRNLGFTTVAKSGNVTIRWSRVNEYLKKYIPQQMGKGDFIPESLVYKLAFKASNEVAEKFQDWLAIEVIPSIRKNGGYIATNEDDTDEDILARAVLVAQKTIDKKNKVIAGLETKTAILEQRVAEYEPKVNYLDTILNSKDTVTISQIAEDYGMSASQMNKLLHKHGVQYKINGQWLLYSKHKGLGYTKSKPIDIKHSDGSYSVKLNTRWTQKGRLFIYETLKKHRILPLMDIQLNKQSELVGQK